MDVRDAGMSLAEFVALAKTTGAPHPAGGAASVVQGRFCHFLHVSRRHRWCCIPLRSSNESSCLLRILQGFSSDIREPTIPHI